MCRTCSSSSCLLALLGLLLASCSEKPAALSEEVTPKTTAPEAKGAKQRPPFPNMATASWGSTVMDELQKGARRERGLAANLEEALKALHSLDDDAAQRVVGHGAGIFQAAESDGDRALGAALAAVGLALDPRVAGYKERLTDAHGLAAFAGTFEGGTAVAQAARAYIAVTAGRVFEGQKLIDVMSTSSRVDADSALLLALARYTIGQRGDEVLAQARLALTGKPESARARAILARVYLDLGLPDESLRVLDEGKAVLGEAPALTALRGRAQLQSGALDAGSATLDAVLARLTPAEQGETRFALARAFSQSPAHLERAEAQRAALLKLSGFEREAQLIEATLSDARGESEAAKERVLKVCKGRGLPFDIALECLWTTTEICARAGDESCVREWGPKAVGSDDDLARLERARATLARATRAPLDGGSAPEALGDDERASLVAAHLLSPFDPALGQKLGLEVVSGEDAAARQVRGARRALALGAKKAAADVLEALSAKHPACRVCRALLAQVPEDPEDAATRAIAALAGKGPPLAERDVIALLDVLGGSASQGAKAAVDKLASDARPAVQQAARTAKKDQANPEGRAARKAEAAAKAAAPGTAPVPGSTDHGEHR